LIEGKATPNFTSEPGVKSLGVCASILGIIEATRAMDVIVENMVSTILSWRQRFQEKRITRKEELARAIYHIERKPSRRREQRDVDAH
jgi:hypothetical protein